MTLQSTGAISLSNVNTELGLSSTALISLNDSAVRSLAGVASGAISLNNLYGKTYGTVVTVTETTANDGTYTYYGFLNGTGGSVSPTTVLGATILDIVQRSDNVFLVYLSGNLAKSFFTAIDVQGYGLLQTADSGHSANAAETFWLWSGVTATGWDGTGTRTVTFK